MIDKNSLVELSNHKKYLITDSSFENNKIYYLALEVDYNTEVPSDNSLFFEQRDDNTLYPVTNEDDVDFLKTIFVNKFLDSISE